MSKWLYREIETDRVAKDTSQCEAVFRSWHENMAVNFFFHKEQLYLLLGVHILFNSLLLWKNLYCFFIFVDIANVSTSLNYSIDTLVTWPGVLLPLKINTPFLSYLHGCMIEVCIFHRNQNIVIKFWHILKSFQTLSFSFIFAWFSQLSPLALTDAFIHVFNLYIRSLRNTG